MSLLSLYVLHGVYQKTSNSLAPRESGPWVCTVWSVFHGVLIVFSVCHWPYWPWQAFYFPNPKLQLLWTPFPLPYKEAAERLIRLCYDQCKQLSPWMWKPEWTICEITTRYFTLPLTMLTKKKAVHCTYRVREGDSELNVPAMNKHITYLYGTWKIVAIPCPFFCSNW